ncbi:MAG TPA: ATP-binding protein [Calditrichia bacterium]|nr:ATP-binding protein [Calditrichia bacterium]
MSDKAILERHLAAEEIARVAYEIELSEYRHLIEAIPDMLIATDGESRVIRWNSAAANMLGVGPSQALGKKFYDLPVSWDWPRIRENISQCLTQMSSGEIPVLGFQCASGEKGYLKLTILPVFNAEKGPGGMLLMGSNITEKILLEQQLAQAQRLESIGQLAAGVAHEINTPMQYIKDNTTFFQESFEDLMPLLEKFGELADVCGENSLAPELLAEINRLRNEVDLDFLLEDVPTALRQSLDGISRVTKIVQAMKNFSHPGQEEKSAVDLNQAIETTITVSRNEWKYVSELHTDLDPDLPLVPCLLGEFNQVMLNIVVNAAHAIEEKVKDTPGKRGEIRIATRQEGQYAEVTISDTGTGIPDAIRDKIFNPFFTTKEVGKGTGQGLSIVHQVIVKQHNGRIAVESTPGEGTVFRLSLPLHDETFDA